MTKIWVRSEVNFVPYQLARLKYIILVTKPVQVTPPFRIAFYAGLFWVILAISVIPAKTLFFVRNHFCLRKLVDLWDWDNDKVSAEPTATSWPYSVNLHLSFLPFFLSSPLLRLTPAPSRPWAFGFSMRFQNMWLCLFFLKITCGCGKS